MKYLPWKSTSVITAFEDQFSHTCYDSFQHSPPVNTWRWGCGVNYISQIITHKFNSPYTGWPDSWQSRRQTNHGYLDAATWVSSCDNDKVGGRQKHWGHAENIPTAQRRPRRGRIWRPWVRLVIIRTGILLNGILFLGVRLPCLTKKVSLITDWYALRERIGCKHTLRPPSFLLVVRTPPPGALKIMCIDFFAGYCSEI